MQSDKVQDAVPFQEPQGSLLASKKVKEKRTWILRSRLEELEKKANQTQEYLDHLQRLQAEFENYRKRNVKDREEFRKSLLEEFILELLGILDNFERALEAVRTTQGLENLGTGVQMIYRQFQEVLARRGVTSIEALGHPFDPLKHEAVCHEETKEHPPHQVMGQMTRGYLLHGKVVRPAKVKVSKEPSISGSDRSPSGEVGSPGSSARSAEAETPTPPTERGEKRDSGAGTGA